MIWLVLFLIWLCNLVAMFVLRPFEPESAYVSFLVVTLVPWRAFALGLSKDKKYAGYYGLDKYPILRPFYLFMGLVSWALLDVAWLIRHGLIHP